MDTNVLSEPSYSNQHHNQHNWNPQIHNPEVLQRLNNPRLRSESGNAVITTRILQSTLFRSSRSGRGSLDTSASVGGSSRSLANAALSPTKAHANVSSSSRSAKSPSSGYGPAGAPSASELASGSGKGLSKDSTSMFGLKSSSSSTSYITGSSTVAGHLPKPNMSSREERRNRNVVIAPRSSSLFRGGASGAGSMDSQGWSEKMSGSHERDTDRERDRAEHERRGSRSGAGDSRRTSEDHHHGRVSTSKTPTSTSHGQSKSSASHAKSTATDSKHYSLTSRSGHGHSQSSLSNNATSNRTVPPSLNINTRRPSNITSSKATIESPNSTSTTHSHYMSAHQSPDARSSTTTTTKAVSSTSSTRSYHDAEQGPQYKTPAPPRSPLRLRDVLSRISSPRRKSQALPSPSPTSPGGSGSIASPPPVHSPGIDSSYYSGSTTHHYYHGQSQAQGGSHKLEKLSRDDSPISPYLKETRTSTSSLSLSKRNSTNETRVSKSERRHSLHSEVQGLLNMTAPKRTDTLKYMLVKQPNSPRGLVGLNNLGNTCIFSAELLVGYFLSGDYRRDINSKSPMKGQLATAFGDIVHDVMKNCGLSGKAISPSQIKRQIEHWAPQFAGYSQQDCQEFLRFMLDGLHEDLNRVQVRPKFTYPDEESDKLSDVDKAKLSWNRYHAISSSLVFDIFGGQLQSTVTCLTCGSLSTTFDAFWDLSLPIPKGFQERQRDISLTKSSSPTGRSCTILDCLNEFALEEILDELYKCNNCKAKQKASKSLRLYRCPEILVLHLKRFSYTTYSRDKIETPVSFPITQLSLESIMSATPGRDQVVHYDLFGISNHLGGLGGGHYIAHCKNPDNGNWYQRNDSRVSECSESSLLDMGSSAYVLFFQKSRSSRESTTVR
ncbi:Ubiquitin carboxyl-terminal hydrolase 21 [Blyttiomyces sp. JEL0837]|nr:Ubiquitin carboxyl-terminal hydrolase 21 [Blyttiomyces sp. JEL0837]